MPNYTNFNNNLQSMVPSLIIKRVEMAIQTFLKHDSFLINNNIHEQAISHRLALYLDELFPNYNVDCEWNKVSDDPKLIKWSDYGVDGILESIKRVIDDKIILKEDNTNLVILKELHHSLNDNSKTFTDQSGNTYVNVANGKDIQFIG